MTVVRASSLADLGAILDYVHDRTYDLSRIDLNARERSLTIPIKLRSIRKPKSRWFLFDGPEEVTTGNLIVRKALSYRVADDAKIGEGDINTIEFRGDKVIVNGNLPVNLTIDVEGLEIELALPDDAKLA